MKLSSIFRKPWFWIIVGSVVYSLLLRWAYSDYIEQVKLDSLCKPGKMDSLKKRLEDNPELIWMKFGLGDRDVALVHWVCRYHNLEGIQYLKTLDADFSQETAFMGDTPLGILSKFFYPNTLKTIHEVLESRFVGEEAILKPNRFGTSPIMLSVSYCQPRILKEYLDILNRKGLKVDKDALLQLAVGELSDNKDGCEMVALLVAEGARPLEKNKDGKSPLDMAREGKKNHFVDIMTKNNGK